MNTQELIDFLNLKEKLFQEKKLKELNDFNQIKNCFTLMANMLQPLEDAGVLWFTKQTENKFSLKLKPNLQLHDELVFMKDAAKPAINIINNATVVEKISLKDDKFWLDSGEMMTESTFLDLLAKLFTSK